MIIFENMPFEIGKIKGLMKMSTLQNHILSKSTFLRGKQCLKSLYLKKYHPDLEDKISETQQAILNRGTNVGILAHQLFPDGIDLGKYVPNDFEKAFMETFQLINDGVSIIYEAGFKSKSNICFVDILVKKEGKWYAYEVKSSTSVSDVYLWDTAFQFYVLQCSGIDLEDIFIVHLNNQYVRKGNVDLNQLFTVVSVKKDILPLQNKVQKIINLMQETLNCGSVPDIDIGTQCKNPYDCSFLGHCWQHIPKYSIFNISRLSKQKAFNLYRSGIIEIKDTPDDYPLSIFQQLQVYTEKTGVKTIDKVQIAKFIQRLNYPLCFLDFETFQPPVPMFDESRSFQQIPFQYSLHILDENGDLIHREFLSETKGDPRVSLIEKLIPDLDGSGDIIVYNKSFEVSRLKEIAKDFPNYADKINVVINRIVDLMKPFSDRLYYTKEMKGSYSIKAVLPAVVPGISYDDLSINKGDQASLAFEKLYSETDSNRIKEIRSNLLEYCKLDTLAMVEIFKVLRNF